MADHAAIDVRSLEDFQTTLAARLEQAEAIGERLRQIGNSPPRFGQFADAVEVARWYARLHVDHLHRVERLRHAIVAAQQATASIMANYASTEARNAATGAEIANLLNPIGDALGKGA